MRSKRNYIDGIEWNSLRQTEAPAKNLFFLKGYKSFRNKSSSRTDILEKLEPLRDELKV